MEDLIDAGIVIMEDQKPPGVKTLECDRWFMIFVARDQGPKRQDIWAPTVSVHLEVLGREVEERFGWSAEPFWIVEIGAANRLFVTSVEQWERSAEKQLLGEKV